MKKRIISSLLAVMMVVTLIPSAAFAVGEAGSASLTIVNDATYGGSTPSGVTMDYDVTIGGDNDQISLDAGQSYTYSGLPDNTAYSVTQRAYDNPSYAYVSAETERRVRWKTAISMWKRSTRYHRSQRNTTPLLAWATAATSSATMTAKRGRRTRRLEHAGS